MDLKNSLGCVYMRKERVLTAVLIQKKTSDVRQMQVNK